VTFHIVSDSQWYPLNHYLSEVSIISFFLKSAKFRLYLRYLMIILDDSTSMEKQELLMTNFQIEKLLLILDWTKVLWYRRQSKMPL